MIQEEMHGLWQLENRALSKYTTSYEICMNEGSFMPFVSVIIPTCNNKQFVIRCLDSLAKVDYRNFEIIVVDNASSDGTSGLILKEFPYVRIIRSDVNLGYARGNNLGIRNAKGTYLILLNDDTRVDPHFIFRLVEAMEAEPMAALGSCKIYMMNRNALQYAGGFIDGMGYPLMRGCGEEDKGQYDLPVDIDWASGACMIIKRKYLDHIGLLDEAYNSYYEDTDLSLRAHQNGYKVIYIPKAVIRHYGSATTRRHRRYQVFSVRNRFRFLLKHFECKYIVKAIVWDFFHTPALKAPYLLVALIWSSPSLLSTMFNPSKKYQVLSVGCIRYILYYWRVCTKVFLNSLIGSMRLYKLLHSHNKLNLLFQPFFIVRVKDNIVQTKVGNNILLQPLDNLFLNEEIDFHQVYDRFYDINKDDVIIDVGAHVGVFTIREAHRVERGFVLAIEPHPFNYLLLTSNIKANKLTNVQALNLALWSSNGSQKLYLGSSSGSHSLKYYLKDREKYIEVQTRTLDSIVKELGIKRVNFIKIDVEGSEMEVLFGARETLKRNNPVISVAAYHTPTEIQEVTKYLQGKGYQVLIYESEYIYGFKSKEEVVIENVIR